MTINTMPQTIITSAIQQTGKQIENPHWIQELRIARNEVQLEKPDPQKEYVLSRVVPGLSDFKKHKIRLEQGDPLAVKLQSIMDERGLIAVSNFKLTKRVNAVENLNFCYIVLKVNYQRPSEHNEDYNRTKEKWGLSDDRSELNEKLQYSQFYHSQVRMKEYCLNWIFDIISGIGLHDTHQGYCYFNLLNIYQVFKRLIKDAREKYSFVPYPESVYKMLDDAKLNFVETFDFNMNMVKKDLT